MALTFHVDASDTGNIFTTFNGGGGGIHTGTPVDGSPVQAWDDEGDGMADVVMGFPTVASQSPLWRSVTPWMLLPCLDFDGTDDVLQGSTQSGGAGKALSNFIANTAFTVIVAFYAESITDTGLMYNGTCLLGDLGEFWGIYLRNNGGQRVATGYNYDGTEKGVPVNIAENTSHVLMWRHEAGNLYASINGGTEVSPVASGNTNNLGSGVALGKTPSATHYHGRIGELKIWNTGNADGALAAEVSALTTKWLGAGGAAVPIEATISGTTGLSGELAASRLFATALRHT